MRPVIFFLLLFTPAAAMSYETLQLCFSALDPNKPTIPWAQRYYRVDLGLPIVDAQGIATRTLTGYGFNEAGDLGPVTGTLVQLPAPGQDALWVGSLTSTVRQYTRPEAGKPYYIVTAHWLLASNFLSGTETRANLGRLFVNQQTKKPGRNDRAVEVPLVNIDCMSMPTFLIPPLEMGK